MNNTTIFYFTGTGNSLKIARDLAEHLGNTEIISIPKAIKKEINLDSKRIGIVFPIYMYGIPLLVSDFLDKIITQDKSIYFFAVANYRAEAGGALLQVASKLKQKGLKLSSGFNICMPGNYIANYDIDSIEIKENKFQKWNERLIKITNIINNKKVTKIEKGTFAQCFFGTNILYRLISKNLYNFDKNFWTDDKCNGCEICKKICPVSNIDLQNKRPVWHHKCEQCFACLNNCPKESIQFDKKTIGRKRYKNSFINLKFITAIID